MNRLLFVFFENLYLEISKCTNKMYNKIYHNKMAYMMQL